MASPSPPHNYTALSLFSTNPHFQSKRGDTTVQVNNHPLEFLQRGTILKRIGRVHFTPFALFLVFFFLNLLFVCTYVPISAHTFKLLYLNCIILCSSSLKSFNLFSVLQHRFFLYLLPPSRLQERRTTFKLAAQWIYCFFSLADSPNWQRGFRP